MDEIERLCKKYTDLTKREIGNIRMLAEVLQPLANLEEADIFIDCPCKGGDAIVVAEAKPSERDSSYQKSVVGMLAKAENEPAVARTFRLGISTKEMKARTQENRFTVQSVEPIKNGSRVIGVLIREKKVEDQYLISKNLHISKLGSDGIANMLSHMGAENNWLTEYIDEGLVVVNKEGYVSFRNSAAEAIYKKIGYVKDVLGQPYTEVCIVPPEFGEGSGDFVEMNCGNSVLGIRHVYLDKEDMEFAVIIRDYTWTKEQEKELILKSMAIKEIHHRVKNNLQTIASLLRLQMRRSSCEEVIQVLGETMNRILSIAATHEILARNGVDKIQIGEVLSNIKDNVLRYFVQPSKELKITMEADELEVDSDIATSIALVVNELLQNSLKYAFVGRDCGNVQIIEKRGDLYSSIQVIDDGCGLDEEHMREDSLGLSIVKSLVKDKLRGNLEIRSSEKGTCVSFDFLNDLMEN